MKTYAEQSEAKKFLKFKKINKLFILIITVKYFPCVKIFPCVTEKYFPCVSKSKFFLCLKIFPCVKAKFPVFSLSGKSKNQIPCFPCAVATLLEVVSKQTRKNQFPRSHCKDERHQSFAFSTKNVPFSYIIKFGSSYGSYSPHNNKLPMFAVSWHR